MPRCAARKIAIFGDYDVDGATSSALLARFLRAAGLDPMIHIPDRIFEGYGPNSEAIRSLAGRGATLLITVDCGTTSIEPLAEARRLGMDVIVIDHHQADERLPDALVVNPNRLDDLSELGHLAAVGLCSSRWSRSTACCASAASGTRRGRSPICFRCSTSSRSARSPTWCR